jgi:hypothetical protein
VASSLASGFSSHTLESALTKWSFQNPSGFRIISNVLTKVCWALCDLLCHLSDLISCPHLLAHCPPATLDYLDYTKHFLHRAFVPAICFAWKILPNTQMTYSLSFFRVWHNAILLERSSPYPSKKHPPSILSLYPPLSASLSFKALVTS